MAPIPSLVEWGWRWRRGGVEASGEPKNGGEKEGGTVPALVSGWVEVVEER